MPDLAKPIPAPPSAPTLQDILVIEDDPAVPGLQCRATGIPVWTQTRVVVLRMVMSDLLYGTSMLTPTTSGVPARRALMTMARSLLANTWSHASGKSRADVCLVSSGIGNQLVEGRWFNRLSDYMALACPQGTTTLEGQFEWRWPAPRHNDRVVYHAPFQALGTVASRVRLRPPHRQQADELLDLVLGRARTRLGWEPGPDRLAALRSRVAAKIAALPTVFGAYDRLLAAVRPKVLIAEEGCYGGLAPLLTAARRRGIVTAEYQHGAVTSGHDAYNFAPAVRASAAYRETLPEYFLGYGAWWNEQFNAPVTKIPMGNPHRQAQVDRSVTPRHPRRDILILSDGIEFPLYLALARDIVSFCSQAGFRVVVRPHPLERTKVRAEYGDRAGDVALDTAGDLYASLGSAHAVIGEVSTGLFEAVGLTDRIFVWDTPKARFGYPRHPFSTFESATDLVALLARDDVGRLSMSDLHEIWAPSWRETYLRVLSMHGVQCPATT